MEKLISTGFTLMLNELERSLHFSSKVRYPKILNFGVHKRLPSPKTLEDLQRMIDENLEELNEFKEITHSIEEAVEVIMNRFNSIEKRLAIVEQKYLKDGMTQLERTIKRIIKEESEAMRESLIDFTMPLKEIPKIAYVPRDDSSHTEDKDNG
jgi:hypothetical protein